MLIPLLIPNHFVAVLHEAVCPVQNPPCRAAQSSGRAVFTPSFAAAAPKKVARGMRILPQTIPPARSSSLRDRILPEWCKAFQ
jgi:hypothetical protein